MAYTTANLLSSISLRTFSPTDQNTFTNANLLTLADEECETLLVPEIQGVREEYFVTFKDYAITAGQAAYDVPVRAVGMSAREVQLVSSSGAVADLPQITAEEVTSTQTGAPSAFYIRDNSIVLYPTPSSTQDTLRVHYAKRPSRLVETSSAGLITAIDTASNTITVAVPTGWSTANTFDLMRQDGGQECLAVDLSASNVSSTAITLSSLPSTLRVNDYVALAGESPVVQLPAEYRTVLAQAVTCRVLSSMRLAGLSDEQKRLEGMIEQARKLLTPRVQGAVKKILPPRW